MIVPSERAEIKTTGQNSRLKMISCTVFRILSFIFINLLYLQHLSNLG